jgi:large subunit ribosomal protein L13Ae
MVRALIVVDCKGHLMGRLASIVAKQLQLGQRIVLVRCEQTLISGKHYRNKLNFMDFLHKRTNTNPKKGPFHHVAPSRIMWRTIRGMLPYKTAKGEAALGRLKCFDGCPVSVNAKKKMVIPEALKAVRLHPRAKYSVLGNIAKECGWTKQDLISTVEAKRIGRNHEWYKKKVDNLKKEKEVIKNNKEVQDVNKQLEEYGY